MCTLLRRYQKFSVQVMPSGKGSLIPEREGKPGTGCTSHVQTAFKAYLKYALKNSAGFLTSLVEERILWTRRFIGTQWNPDTVGCNGRLGSTGKHWEATQKPVAHQFWLRLLGLTSCFKERLSDSLGIGSCQTRFKLLGFFVVGFVFFF